MIAARSSRDSSPSNRPASSANRTAAVGLCLIRLKICWMATAGRNGRRGDLETERSCIILLVSLSVVGHRALVIEKCLEHELFQRRSVEAREPHLAAAAIAATDSLRKRGDIPRRSDQDDDVDIADVDS